jgi:hypothetical protein
VSTWNTAAVDKFLRLVKTARDHNSKELKMSVVDAEALAISLATVLNQERELAVKLLACQSQLVNSVNREPTEISLNGGGF